jgi:hypothetical protein
MVKKATPKSVLLAIGGRCDSLFSAGSSKIKIQTSSCNKAHSFDDPAEHYM